MRVPGPLLILILAAMPAQAQETGSELAKIKEQELEEVRERISSLKKSMDESSATRDRLTRQLQEAEVEIAEKRTRLKDLERERDYAARRRDELDAARRSSTRKRPSLPSRSARLI